MAGNLFEALREALIGGQQPTVDVQTYGLDNPAPFVGQDIIPEQMPMPQQAMQSAPMPQPMPAQPAPVSDEPSLFSRFNQMMKDPEKNAQIVMALNSLRSNPDSNLAASMQKRIDAAGETRLLQSTTNMTVEALKKAGRDDLAQLVIANPELAKDALKEASGLRGTKSGMQTSGVQFDGKTGQAYVVQSDPNSGDIKRVEIEGTFGTTPQQKAEIEQKTRLAEQDIQAARDRGVAVFAQMQSVDSSIANLLRARELVNTGEAASGIVSQFLPSFNAATAELRQIANTMGIDIINSATFGALSEAELKLALSTGLDITLEGPELVKFVDKKVAAQRKVRDELFRQAKRLTSNIGYSQFIREFTPSSPSSTQDAPPPVNAVTPPPTQFEGFEVIERP